MVMAMDNKCFFFGQDKGFAPPNSPQYPEMGDFDQFGGAYLPL